EPVLPECETAAHGTSSCWTRILRRNTHAGTGTLTISSRNSISFVQRHLQCGRSNNAKGRPCVTALVIESRVKKQNRGIPEAGSAADAAPTVARNRGELVDVLGHDVPVDHRAGIRAAADLVSNIDAADGEREAEDDAEQQAHDAFPPLRPVSSG